MINSFSMPGSPRLRSYMLLKEARLRKMYSSEDTAWQFTACIVRWYYNSTAPRTRFATGTQSGSPTDRLEGLRYYVGMGQISLEADQKCQALLS